VVPQVTHQLQTEVKAKVEVTTGKALKKTVKQHGAFLDCGLELIWLGR
jgi:hypothetical protein